MSALNCLSLTFMGEYIGSPLQYPTVPLQDTEWARISPCPFELFALCVITQTYQSLLSLNQHFLTVYNVDACFGDRLDSAACDVIDCVLNIAGCNILNTCRDCSLFQNPSCSFV